MYKCQHCNVIIYDETDACPLCQRVLDELPEEEAKRYEDMFGEGSSYPDIRKRKKTLTFVTRLILFLFIVAETIMLVINHYITPNFWWAGICGLAMIYTYISMIYWINHDSGFAMKIGIQIFLTIGVLFFIDCYFTGMKGWSLQWAIPGIILFGDAVVFFLMMLNRSRWYSYTLLLFFMGILSLVIIYIYHIGIISNIIMPVICVGVTGFYLLGTVLFGDREITHELKRRFRV